MIERQSSGGSEGAPSLGLLKLDEFVVVWKMTGSAVPLRYSEPVGLGRGDGGTLSLVVSRNK